MTILIQSFGDEITKLAKDESAVKRKAKGAAKGAVIGGGAALGLPAILAALLAVKGGRGSAAKKALKYMTGRGAPKRLPHELKHVGKRTTQSAAMTGAGLGALTS